jgi:hypothetical protein
VCLKVGPLAGSQNTIRRSAVGQLTSVSVGPRSSAEWVSNLHAALHVTCAALMLHLYVCMYVRGGP